MFQDIGVSKDLNELFKKHVVTSNEPLDIDFGIQVLSSGSWPFQQTFTFLLPSEVKFVYFLKVFLFFTLIFYFSWNDASTALPLFTVLSTVVESYTGCIACLKAKLSPIVLRTSTLFRYVQSFLPQ